MTMRPLTQILIWIVSNCLSVMAIGEMISMLDGVNVSAVLKLEAVLPCDISPPTDDDKPHLIFWYREMSGSPFYSLDLRENTLDSGKHMLGDNLRNRMVFHTQRKPAYLLIHEVEESDEGSYRCRVDFRNSPTRYYVVNLTVIVPPLPPFILDERGLELGSTVGPYNEGSNLFISCEAKEGWPPPVVTWWRDGTLLDDNYEVTSLGIVRNDLVVQTLDRDDFGAVFTCQASNTNLTTPVATSVNLDMNLKPLDVRIEETNRPLSASKRYKLHCHSSGSRPAPIMAWWLGDQRLKDTEETSSMDGNVTTSILTLVPTSADNGKYMSCRAENSAILKSGIEDGRKLDVYFTPIVTLELGGSLKNDTIDEGDDVYLECRITANPFVHAVEWKFQSHYLVNNASIGLVIRNQSLVIQSVKRSHVGPYTCIAINTEGEGESNVFHLHVKHVPVCQSGQKTTYGVAKNEAVHIPCEVIAFPLKLRYRWALNHTSHSRNSTKGLTVFDSTQSTLLYIPRSKSDFGTLLCWATNDIGTQADPCVYTVIAADVPDPVHNCTVYNQTVSSFYVVCNAGYDGGLSQSFFLDIYDSTDGKLKSTLTSPRALFYVSGLNSGMKLSLRIYSSNSKGRSEAIELQAQTKEVADKNDEVVLDMMQMLLVLTGVVIALSFVAIAVVGIMRCRISQNKKQRDCLREQAQRSNILLHKEADGSVDTDEKCPDVIPSNGREVSSYMSFPFTIIDQDFPPVEVKCLQNQYNAQTPQQPDDHQNKRQSSPSTSVTKNLLDCQDFNHSTRSNSHKVKPVGNYHASTFAPVDFTV